MSIRDRLRLVFRRGPVTAPAATGPALFHEAPEIEFVAYAEDCRLFGHTRLDASRLTDMLNDHAEVELIDVAMEALADGRIAEVRSMVVAREELLVVQASGPRGARERRHRTRPHPVAVQSGPYIVRGHLHALPTADPFAALHRRPPMVPLTEGSITYSVAGQSIMRRTDTIIVNRSVIDWIVPATDDEVRFPELPATSGILVKDFTGLIYDLREAGPTADVDPDVDATPAPAADLPATADAGGTAPDEAGEPAVGSATAKRRRRRTAAAVPAEAATPVEPSAGSEAIPRSGRRRRGTVAKEELRRAG
jgi:hypothetical protein